MRTKRLPLIIGALAFIAVAGASFWLTVRHRARPTSPALGASDYVVAGIEPGAEATVVRGRLGRPLSVSQQSEISMHNPDYMTYWETWHYRGLRVLYVNNAEKGLPRPQDPGVVATMTATTRAYVGPRGIRVHDPIAKALRIFGATDPDADGYYWYDSGEGCYLRFYARGGRISEVEVGFTFD